MLEGERKYSQGSPGWCGTAACPILYPHPAFLVDTQPNLTFSIHLSVRSIQRRWNMSYSPKESKSNVTEVKTRAGITLVPSPTNDPQDPLVSLSLSRQIGQSASQPAPMLTYVTSPELASAEKVPDFGHSMSGRVRWYSKLPGESACF